MTKARELAELGAAVSVHDNRVDFDRQLQVRGLTDAAQIISLSLDSAEASTIASLYTCPGSTKTIIIGKSAANVLPNNNVDFSAAIMDSATDSSPTHIVKNVTIAPGGTEVIVGGDHKIIMQTADRLKAVASDSDSLDVIVSYVEQT